MSRNLSNISDIATERQNTTGVMSPILEVQPQDGVTLLIENTVERGQQSRGVPIYAELKDSADNNLPQDTRMAIQFEAPTDDGPKVVSEPLENIRVYRTLSILDQQNEEYIDAIKHVLKGSALQIDDVDTMYVAIKSDTQLDWANSRLEFESDAVTEV